MTRRPLPKRGRPSEEGYVLVALIFMLAILILSMAIAIPRVRASIQRDREIETMQRGKQYIRAVQLYYRKFNAYPPNVDALVKTNNIRFLRKKYVDPTTGKDVWKPVLYGQNKTPQAVGFFGQPLAGGALAGTGPGAGNGIAGGSGTPGNGTAGSGLFNSSNSTSSSSSTDAGTGAAAGTSSGTTGGVGATTGTDSSGNPVAGGGTTASGTSGTTGSSFGSGQSFGGAGIIGFSPGSTKQSILVYKKKNHFNEWEFLYSPLAERQQMTGGNTGTVGQPAGSTTTPIGGSPTTGSGPTTGGGATTAPVSTSPTSPSSNPQ